MLPTHSVGASGSCSVAPLPFVCWRLLLSRDAFTSASCPASASRHTSALHCTPCVWLVVAFPRASAAPSCRTTARCLSLRHSSCIHLLSRPSCLVGCHFPQCLNPHLAATLPGALASVFCFALACNSIWRCLLPLPPPYLSLTTSPSPEQESGLPDAVPVVIAAWGLLCCCHSCRCPHTRTLPARGFPHRCPCCVRLLPGRGPKEGASLSG